MRVCSRSSRPAVQLRYIPIATIATAIQMRVSITGGKATVGARAVRPSGPGRGSGAGRVRAGSIAAGVLPRTPALNRRTGLNCCAHQERRSDGPRQGARRGLDARPVPAPIWARRNGAVTALVAGLIAVVVGGSVAATADGGLGTGNGLGGACVATLVGLIAVTLGWPARSRRTG
ncbi:DUF6223 family protein [Streptomyces sp. NPDC056831]|uniref:DUF6223 family protein n=1 Tax=Streptomyces sp. NPDC056831 TaxID=3345954 RepID=UPI003690FB30